MSARTESTPAPAGGASAGAARIEFAVAGAPGWFGPLALALGAVAGALLAGRPAGLGATLLLWGLLGAAAATSRRADRWAGAWLGSAALLAVVPTVRSAGWVVAISLLGALALGSLGLAGGQTWRAVARGALAWLTYLLPGPIIVGATALRGSAGRDWQRLAPAARSALLALPLLILFGSLFAAADAAFAELLDDAFAWAPGLEVDAIDRIVLALAVVALAGAFLRAAHLPPSDEAARRHRLGATEWAIALGALNALFGAFVAVQLTAMFGGHEFVARTANLTYSEYARQGFGQLVAVGALTLWLIAWARRDSRVLRLLLGGLCALNLVVLVSALGRLGLYEDAYGFTRARFLAHTAILWMGALFAALLGAGIARREAWLPRVCVGLTAAFLVGFAAVNPDARIAEGNLARGGEVDGYYLNGLSANAAGVLGRCERPEGGPLSFNVGRSRARC